MTTTVTPAKFRADYPEFSDKNRFPDSQINYWLKNAPLLINEGRWGKLFDTGVELMIAHNIAMEREAMDASLRGGIPGKSAGIMNNKSVDKVSVGYDVQTASELNAGHWNLTIYGMRYIRMARLMGAGPVQIGVDCGSGFAGAWPGPWQYNFPNPS